MTPDIITKATMTAATATAPSISKAIYTVSSATTKTSTSTLSSLSMRTATTAISAATSTTTSSPSTTSIVQRHRLTIEKLRHRVHQILKCVLESNVNQLLDEVKEFNADLMEVKRLDDLIETLRDYSGPTIYHEWPFPLVCHATIDEADLAQTLNTS
ncbi:intermembrane lipid transfer protein vps13F isoform X2 [Calliphora vicina]|uniref:intermembrane lipid transfer protein vps13F isoform X2 n=1 Tax=Calliphora vicina TaxID=7373 RepID=UPI00325A5C97